MKKILPRLAIFFAALAGTSSGTAGEFIAHNVCENMRRALINSYGAEEVFSQNEQEFLKGSGIDPKALKLTINEKQKASLAAKLKSCPKAVLEGNPLQKSLSSAAQEPYESLQWALKNEGKDLTEWESDIDVSTTAGAPGEDIGAALVKEEMSRKILVAVVDSGVDTEHPDLKNALVKKPLECQALAEYKTCLAENPDREFCHKEYSSRDADRNGYPMDCSGWNLNAENIPGAKVDGAPDMFDTDGHGTHVAGIIAARRNKEGVAGAAQSAIVLPIKVGVTAASAGEHEAPTDKIAKGILYAVAAKAHIINLSLGWRFEQDSMLMRQMIELALSKNILITAAAGNDSHDGPVYPCSYEGVVCVASHSVDGKLSAFSNYGAHVDIAAPGSKILSAWPKGKRSRSFTQEDSYEYLSGTSQAAPYVAAVLARLLNQGVSPLRAKAKLLKGARPFNAGDGKLVRTGKADLARALKAAPDAFLYPANKSPALVKWDEKDSERGFKLKFQTLGGDAPKSRIEIYEAAGREDVKVLTTSFGTEALPEGSVTEKRVLFTAPFSGSGDFLFKVVVDTNGNKKSYYIQAKAVNLFDGESEKSGQEIFKIANPKRLEDASVNKFETVGNYPGTDFLASKEINGSLFVSLLKQKGAQYSQSAWRKLPLSNAIFLNLSKVDLDLDGSPDYVVTLVDLKDKERKTLFYAFTEGFEAKRILIAPKNVYNNELSVMPGRFQWLRHKDRMVPAWINVGERPASERPQATPWEDPEPELKINRMYLLTVEGAKTLSFPGEEEMPLSFLYQSRNSKDTGSTIVLTGDSFGYFKRYKAYVFNGALREVASFNLNPYIDLLNSKPLPLAGSRFDSAFFQQESLGGARLVSFEYVNQELKMTGKRVSPLRPSEPIIRVLSYNGEDAISQTRYNLHAGSAVLPARTGAQRIKHDILQGQSALYLRSSLTPGLAGELVALDSKGNLTRPAKGMALGLNDCQEAGFAREESAEKLLFACPASGKIIKFQFSL